MFDMFRTITDTTGTDLRFLENRNLKAKLTAETADAPVVSKVNGLLPFDFAQSFATAELLGEGVPASAVNLVGNKKDPNGPQCSHVVFRGSCRHRDQD